MWNVSYIQFIICYPTFLGSLVIMAVYILSYEFIYSSREFVDRAGRSLICKKMPLLRNHKSYSMVCLNSLETFSN